MVFKVIDHCRSSLKALVLLGIACTAGCETEQRAIHPPDLALGRRLFETYCAACHKVDGTGQDNGPPPLAGSNWVAGPEARIIKIVLHGLRGSIEVKGQTYNLEMLSFGPILTDEEIAATLSYVRSELGNSSPPISSETVGRVRQETRDRNAYWTVEELLKTP